MDGVGQGLESLRRTCYTQASGRAWFLNPEKLQVVNLLSHAHPARRLKAELILPTPQGLVA